MFEFIAVIVCVYAIVTINSMGKRVSRLEQLLTTKSQTPPNAQQSPSGLPMPTMYPNTSPVLVPQAPAVTSVLPQVPASVPYVAQPDPFLAWLKEDWLLKMGALFLLIAFGWLASYAFLHDWIGPFGRILLGLTLGTTILIIGSWRIVLFVKQGAVFLVLGSSSILLTVFAARSLYDMFTPVTALIIMFASVAYVAFASVIHKRPQLALAALILAGIAPYLTSSPKTDDIALFSYLLVVVLGAVWVVFLTANRTLVFASLAMVAIYSTPYLMSSHTDERLLLFAFAFVGIFFITNIAGIIKDTASAHETDIMTAAGSGVLLAGWIFVVAPKEWQSLMLSAWTVVFLAGAFAMVRLTTNHIPFYIYSGVGLGLLAAATAVELDGAALTIAYIIESGVVVVVASLLFKNPLLTERASLLFIGPMLLSLGSITSNAWVTSAFNSDFAVLAIMATVLMTTGIAMYLMQKQNGGVAPETAGWQFIIGTVYVHVLFWLTMHSLFVTDIATMFLLFVYTIIGIAVYVTGVVEDKKFMRMYGGVLLGFVAARLLLVDVWMMELSGRIITFFIIGVAFMATAFMKKKNTPSLPIQPTV